jgi:hypothetical protein
LFFITLVLYLTATAATALSWGRELRVVSIFTGAGIGGEYTATDDPGIGAGVRMDDLVINGFCRAAMGLSAIVLLDPGDRS